MIRKIELIMVDEDGNELEPDKDGCVSLLQNCRCIARITYYRHIRQITVHWFTHSSYEKVCRNLFYKKAYEFFFENLYSDNHYAFNHKQSRHKYRHRWSSAQLQT